MPRVIFEGKSSILSLSGGSASSSGVLLVSELRKLPPSSYAVSKMLFAIVFVWLDGWYLFEVVLVLRVDSGLDRLISI